MKKIFTAFIAFSCSIFNSYNCLGESSGGKLNLLIALSNTVVVGEVISGGPGEVDEIHSILKEVAFKALLPRYAMPVVTLKITDVLKGNHPKNNRIKFYRLSSLTLATENIMKHDGAYLGMSGIWILNKLKDSEIFWADKDLAYQPIANLDMVRNIILNPKSVNQNMSTDRQIRQQPYEDLSGLIQQKGLGAIALLQQQMKSGIADKKRESIWLVNQFGIIPLIPNLIEAITDKEIIPMEGHMIFGTVGSYSSMMLLRYVSLLDKNMLKPKQESNFILPGYIGNDYEFNMKAFNVQENWRKWWEEYKE